MLAEAAEMVAARQMSRNKPRTHADYRQLLREKDLDIVIVGGNHDSPGRLDAPQSLLSTLGVRVIGGLPRRPDGSIDVERAVLPLRRLRGNPRP